jgi:thymidylate synthase
MGLGDVHIYEQHVEAVRTQITRVPYMFPQITIPNIREFQDIDSLTFENFSVTGYTFHPIISAPMIP